MSQIYFPGFTLAAGLTNNTIPVYKSATNNFANSGIVDSGTAMTLGSSAYNSGGYKFMGTGQVSIGGTLGVGVAASSIPLTINGAPGSAAAMVNIQTPSTATDGVLYLSAGTSGGATAQLVVNGSVTGRSAEFGTFTDDPLYVVTNNIRMIEFNPSGNIVPTSDNFYSLGSHNDRFADIHAAALDDVSTINASNGIAVTISKGLIVIGGGIQIGGTTASFPALINSGAGLIVRLADNSADTTLQASQFLVSSGTFLQSTTGLTNNAGSSAGTLTNAPAVGNPTKWMPINDNGTIRNIPAW